MDEGGAATLIIVIILKGYMVVRQLQMWHMNSLIDNLPNITGVKISKKSGGWKVDI